MKSSIAFVFALTTTACVDTVETTGEATSEIKNTDPTDPEDTPTNPTPPPPIPPTPPPPNGSNVLRISSAELQNQMVILLNDGVKPLVTVDTMGSSPVRYGNPHQVAVWPNEEIREQEQAACRADYSGSELLDCLKQVNIDYPSYYELHTVWDVFHSYIDFNSYAEAATAQDILFNVTSTYKDIPGPGGVTLDVNYLRSSTDASKVTASFTSTYLDTKPTASLWLSLVSNYPTVRCVHSEPYLGCPDLDLTNMRLNLRFTSIGPGATAGTLGFALAPVTFTFSSNLTNFPDWFLSVFVDVDAKIRSGVEGKLSAALQSEAGRAAINKTLTGIVFNQAKLVHPTLQNLTGIRQTWFDAGQLVVAYDWN